MKTSIILIGALFLNTTLLLVEPLSIMLRGIGPWVFVAIESVLVTAISLNLWCKKMKEACKVDFGYLEVFVLDGKTKTK
ncbi:MAG: hypothetical protein WBM83_12690 [Flavobacteriaceae bacterium]